MWKKVIFIILKTVAVLFLLAVIAVSASELNKYNKGKNESRELAKEVVSEISEESNIPDGIAPISVDFEALMQKNSDIIGWLYCPDTPINYAIVQARDNDYYLRRGFDKKYSYSGTLFADFRNSGDFSDKNTIIYGHNMKNTSMFGTLINYEEQGYFDKHSEMYLLTPDETYKIKLIAGIKETSTAELYEGFLQPEKAREIIDEAISRSTFSSDYVFSGDDRFLTLSTCSYDYNEARYIVIGKLEKIKSLPVDTKNIVTTPE